MKIYFKPEDGTDAAGQTVVPAQGLPFDNSDSNPEHSGFFNQGNGDDVDLLPNESRQEEKQDDQPDVVDQVETEKEPEPVPEQQGTKDNAEVNDDKAPLKIGDNEYTQEQLSDIIGKFNNMNEWESNLRNLSHVKNLDPDTVKALVPYARAHQPLPSGIDKNPIVSGVIDALKDKTFEVSYKDEDGYEQKVDLNIDAIQPMVETIVERALSSVAPVLQEAESVAERIRLERGEEMLKNFIEKHSSRFAFHADLKNKSLMDHLNDVRETGKDHPDYKSAMRLAATYREAQAQGFKSLDEAYEFLYGDIDSDSKTINKIKENQKGGIGEKPGHETPKMDEFSDIFNFEDPASEVLSFIPKHK